MRRMRVAGAVGAVALSALVPAVQDDVQAEPPPPPDALLLGAEDNRLIAYDPVTGASEVALGSAAEGGLDLNAQICADPDHPGYFIAGEDTDQDSGDPADAPGWGYLHLTGTGLDDLAVEMVGNLVPTYSDETDNPENYGCGFLSDGRLVTTDVGDQQPFAGANGQLILWFPDPVVGFASNDVAYCKIDVDIPTAGGVYVDAADRVYVAANRPGLPTNLDLGGIYRYEGSWPTGPTAAEGCGDPGRVTKSLFILGEPLGALTPSAIVARPGGGYYVSSVLTGVIAQYDDAGHFVRRILEPPLLSIPPYPTGTPFGLAVGADGSLFYADIGVQLSLPDIGPGSETGSVRRIRFVDGQPQHPETLRRGLDFPDGLGFVPLEAADLPFTPTDPRATSQWPCGSWGMYGAGVERTFSTECPTAISPATATTMLPAWIVRMPRTVTATPAVVDGTVYVGDWSGTMYALRASDGGERWRFRVADAPGAAFGPIVSSAAVADVTMPSGGTKRLVIFGAGPHLYALDATDGSLVWLLDRSAGVVDTPVEMESSPLVYEGVVYVGLDVHNHGVDDTNGVRGGLQAVDAATGALLWAFEPELGQTGVGCGDVWSSPTIDTAERNVLFGTGNCSASAEEFTWTPHTEAITAIDLDTHEVEWTFQPHGPNRLDVDFGATSNIITLADGQRLVGVGSKDAAYYALDPHTGGLWWRAQVAEPGNVGEDFAIGGFIGSTATWRGSVFGGTALGGPPWYHSLNGADGTRRWSGIAGPSYAASAVVNGVVFSGDLTGTLKAFRADNGLPIGVWPLLGPISSAPAIAGDLLVIGSGTSSSDLCAKGAPGSEACFALFDTTLGSIGAVTAFRPLRLLGALPVLHL